MAAESIIRGLINKGKSVRQIEEPWWSKRYGDVLGGIAEAIESGIGAIGVARDKRAVQYSREQATLNTFTSRLNTSVNNAFSDSTIYSNKTLDEIEATMSRMYSEDIKRFPKQQADISDIYESKKEELKGYRSLNNHYSYLSSKIPDSKQFLLDMTNKLSTMEWEELTPEARIQLEKELMEGTKNIATLGKMMKNNATYFSNHKTFNRDKDDVEIGIIGGYNQLLTQIDTLDPDGNIINKRELSMMSDTIRNNSPDKMNQRLDRITGEKTTRITDNAKDFDKAHTEWKDLSAYSNDPTFKQEYNQRMGEYKTFLEDLKSKLNKKSINQSEFNKLHKDYIDDPTRWSSMVHIDKTTGQGIDVRSVGVQMNTLQDQMDTIDADYKVDTGNKYSGWRGRATPWRKTDEELEVERKIKLKKDVIKGTGVIGLPDTGAGVVTPTGVEPFAVSELHKEVTPKEPIMPTGIIPTEVPEEEKPSYIAYIDSMHKELSKKHKTPIKNIKSLWNDYEADDDIKIGFDDYVGDALMTTPPEEKKVKKVKGSVQLTEERKGKTVVNYDVADTHNFKRQQVDLQNIASNKFKSISKDDKKKHGNVRDFVKAKYTEWLKKTGKHGKGAWYTEGDFVYFFPTKVGPQGTITNIPDVDTYDLFDRRINKHPAFKKVKGLPVGTTSSSYENFAKDFDAFRKFLQES